jgi:alkylation response protein AidB-like acyl-CoA dehydrogenase
VQRPLNPRERRIVDLAGGLADRFAAGAGALDRENAFPSENYELLEQAGYLKLTVPEEFGGLGASLYETLLAQERLAMGDPATALTVNMHVIPIGQWAALWRRNGNAAIEDVLRRAGAGELVWASFTSERGMSNTIMDSSTRARRVDGGYLISGYKIFCTNITAATDFTITARLDEDGSEPQLLLLRVNKDAAGLTPTGKWDTLGMRATQSIDLEIEDLFVSEDALFHAQPVGHLTEAVARTILCWGMTSFGAIYSGLAAGAIEWAKETVLRLGRQSDPLVQNAFADMEILLETGRALLYRHAHEVGEGLIYEQIPLQDVVARAALAKMVPVNNAIQILEQIVDVVGGAALSRSLPLERLLRDAYAGPVMPLNNHTARKLIGASALGITVAPVAEAVPL